MGTIIHRAVIVTSASKERILKAYDVCQNLGLNTTNIVESKVNGYHSFLVVSSGSKEGWAEAELHICQLKELFPHLIGKVEWVCVSHGDDVGKPWTFHERSK